MDIRRRSGLVAVVTLGSAAVAATYLWRFAVSASEVALLVGLLLSVIAVLHGLAWSGARKPLLVADDTGLRVRLGSAWTGVPWSQVERVQIDERGRLSDGHVRVEVAAGAACAAVLAGAGRRSRFAAWSNTKLYGAPLAVPYGVATRVTTDDVAAELVRLASGRASVVVQGASPEDPEPSVEITAPGSPTAASPSDEVDTVEIPPFRPEQRAPEQRAPQQRAPDPARVSNPAAQPVKVAAREAVVQLPLRRAVSVLRSQPARREEVTIAMHREATEGMLALSAITDEVHTEELPKIAELRRRNQSEAATGGGGPDGNISLIIDATTDMSARAMRKVRSLSPPHDVVDDSDADRGGDAAPAEERATPRIGVQLRQARENLGLTVDDLADRTRIRPFVIECMEADDYSPCGGDFYARGHLRMLARVLGIGSAPLLAAYDDAFATSPVDPRAVFDVELATGTTGLIRGGAPGANWGGLVAAVLILVLVWGVAKFFADGVSPAPAAPESTQNSSGLGSPGVGNAPIPPPPDAHVKLTATGGDSRVVVRDRFREVVFEGVLRAGRSQKVAGESPLRVWAADAGAVSLSVNGRALGTLGPPSQPATERITAAAAAAAGRADSFPTNRRMGTHRVPSG